MANKIDITGNQYGRWTVLWADESKNGYWFCQCACGNIKSVDGKSLRSGGTKSCGCIVAENGHKKRNNLDGMRFGRWTVLYRISDENGNSRKCRCRCDCGTERDVIISNLKRGYTTSCGCLCRDINSKRMETHGKSDTRLYWVYRDMLERCYTKSKKRYKDYGGRGILVCEEWLGDGGFQNFWDWAYTSGYDENAPRGQCTLDRIDVNGNYEPSNCRWVNMKVQQRNRRDNRFVEYHGEKMTISELAEKTGVSSPKIVDRLNRGYSVEDAIYKGNLRYKKGGGGKHGTS